MSGLLHLASCSTLTPGAARRGGSAPNHARTPSLALVLSGGVHLLALAVVVAIAARSGLVEPPKLEIKAWIDTTPFLLPPLETHPPATASRPANDDRGRIKPVGEEEFRVRPSNEPFTEGPVKGDDFDTSPTAGRQPDGGAPTYGGNPAVNPDVATDIYDQAPTPIVAPEPPYPELPREAGIEGRVILEALVTWEGRVGDVRIKEGNRMLAEPAAKVVKTWRFRPARWRGQAVTTWVSIPIVFKLH